MKLSTICQTLLLSAPLLASTSCHAQNVSTTQIQTVKSSVTPPADYRRLRDVVIFDKDKLGQASDAGDGRTIEVLPDKTLPVDTAQTFEDRPSYRVNVTGSGGHFQVQLAGVNWATYDVSDYRKNGALEFNLKGAAGGERFTIQLRSRGARSNEGAAVVISDFVTSSTRWQKVRIPLSKLVPDTSKIDLHRMWVIAVFAADEKPLQFWLNDIRFSSPDNEPGFAPIKVNQLGYTTNAPKYALVSGFPEEFKTPVGAAFQVKNTKNGQAVFNGKLTLVSNFDATASGERVLNANFSGLKTPGEYRVFVAGLPASLPFKIGDSIYKSLLFDTSRYFYYQRSGMALDAKYAGKWARGVGHPSDAHLPLQSNPQGPTRDVSGGWYDAGDYGKYVSMCAVPISDLLWSYETFPDQFKDGQNNIPESGNGIPDILDEVKWETDWVLKMQDANSGGFYQMVWPNNAQKTPDKDTQQRFIYDQANGQNNVRATATTANAVAALSHASVVFGPFNFEYSNRLLDAAKRGWAYLQANPTDIVVTGMTGSDDNDRDNRLWAAAALYRASGDASCQSYFLSHYAGFTQLWQSDHDNAYVGDLSPLAMLDYMKTPKPDAKVVAWFRTQFGTWRATQIRRWKTRVWPNFLLDQNYYWGSNSVTLGTTLLLAVGSRELGTYDADIVNSTRANLNYILGVNPRQFSYVTGYGGNCVQNVYSCIWSNDGIDAIPPGYMAGGANQYEGHAFSRFAAKCYSDVDTEWTTNENAIYWNSCLVFNVALVNHEAKN